jgi:phytoene synthase
MTLALDPERRLALAYVRTDLRPAMEALWNLDLALGSVLTTGREEMISRIRLAWWRESLEKLDAMPAPAEPVLQAVAAHVLPRGITGAELAAIEQGWARLLPSEPLTPENLSAYAGDRGERLFRCSARLLGGPEDLAAPGGGLWALVDLARRTADSVEVGKILDQARSMPVPDRWPRDLRPLGMLAMLARRDAARPGGGWEAQGSPLRIIRMVRHRLTGG